MKSTIKLLSVIGALGLVSVAAVHGFSLGGPSGDNGNPTKEWQDPRRGYLDGYHGGPMLLGEFYRINVPVVTYAYDSSFLNYFGTNGVAALETMMKFMNDLPPMSSITNDGTSFYINGLPVPMDTKFINFEAQALGLLDIKALAWGHLFEEIGLHYAENWVWALRDRFITPGPGTNYSVIKMNYDPITLTPSSFVNGQLYSYTIIDGPVVSDAIETPLDPFTTSFTTVANILNSLGFVGMFYNGLTHDDIGGLKYLYSTNRLAVETLLPTVTPRGPGAGGGTNLIGAPWTPIFLVTNVFGTNVTGTNVTTTNNIVNVAPRPGVNKIFFQRVEFDSIIGNFIPRTNIYADVFYTNSRARFQLVQRGIALPDYIFGARDIGTAQGQPVISERTVPDGWINNDPINGNTLQGGPGVITFPIQITFTDVFPALFNSVPFVDEFSAFNIGIWGSFDGTTNAPIVYPIGGSWNLDALRNAATRGQRPQ
jgi:hypothetical protein